MAITLLVSILDEQIKVTGKGECAFHLLCVFEPDELFISMKKCSSLARYFLLESKCAFSIFSKYIVWMKWVKV